MTDPLCQRHVLFKPQAKDPLRSFLLAQLTAIVRNKMESGNNSSLTVSDVKVMHIPPKPFRASAMNISTDRAATVKKKKKMPLAFTGVESEGDRALRALVLTRKNLSESTPSGRATLFLTQHPSPQPHRAGGPGLSSQSSGWDHLSPGWKGFLSLMNRFADAACLNGS